MSTPATPEAGTKRSQHDDQLRVERDLQIARDIQRGFLPRELPALPGWQIAARFSPAYEVAGDFYDMFFLSNKVRLGFIVADVCDKGIGSALFMGLARSLLRAFAQQNYTVNWAGVFDDSGKKGRRHGRTGVGVTALKNAVTLTNNYIANNHGESNMFATLFFGILDPETGEVNYVNGGHPPPLIVNSKGQVTHRLTLTAPPVGVFPDVEFGIEQAQLDPGDTLLMFTDGIVEAKNAADEVFSDERLETLLASAPRSAENLLDSIEQAVREHAGEAAQSDDITLLALRREPVP